MTNLQILREKIDSSSISSIPHWLRRERLDIQEWIIEQTSSHQVKNMMERIYIILNGEPPKCMDGNHRKFDTFPNGYRTCCSLGNKCLSVRHDRVVNQQATLMSTHGVKNAFNLPSTKEKTKQTNLRKYGVEHHSQNLEIMGRTNETKKNKSVDQKAETLNRRRKSNIEKFGVTHHMKLASHQEKVKQTNLQKYGVEFPLQHNDSVNRMKETSKLNDMDVINTKRKRTLIDTYGVTAASRIGLSTATIQILDNQTMFCEFVTGKTRQDALDQLGISEHTLYLYAIKYNARDLFMRPLRSQFEVEVAEWLTANSIEFVQNSRDIIRPKEVDFFLPALNIAIECCGIYWHSELSAGRTRTYHYDKHKACREVGIQLITIFQDEWIQHKDKITQLLKNKVSRSLSIAARKCEVIECTAHQATEFINEHHLQGYTPSEIKIGLTFDDKLVAIMTFGKSRFSKSDQWEIIRYCSSMNITGGANKLLKNFIKNHNPSCIVSYSDNRYFTGAVYESMGFEQRDESIGYFYTDYKNRFNRMKFQKHKLVEQGYDALMTEWEIMQLKKFDRIWDCGQIKWVKTFPTN